MTKTRRMLGKDIALVDVVIELLDARIPYSSKNPDLDIIAAHKRRIISLNKADLADPSKTAEWMGYYKKQGHSVVETDSVTGKGMETIADIARTLMSDKVERQRSRGRVFAPIRAMVVGVPNVGKSTLINKYTGSAAAKAADKPGVTRGKQWVRIRKDFELLDTPGILWPKFDDKNVGMRLAFTGAINDEILDRIESAAAFITLMREIAPDALKTRYKIDVQDEASHDVLEMIARARGFLLRGRQLDMERAAIILLDEFRGGKLGRITLEVPTDSAGIQREGHND
jgi:ribosome biogenesis GTPase A